jgi:YrbI family 3-deoxy-D-manno-octulosonate 8-phosphate phosphatase
MMKFSHLKQKKKIKNLKIIIFDFDGVFTNNFVFVDENGVESVMCNRSDGYGLQLLKKVGVDYLILSSEVNKVVEKRAEKLKIECHSGVENKLAYLKEILDKKKLSSENAAFVGNDINDIDCMKYLGLGVAVRDAYPSVRKASNLILKKSGGFGAVREFCELIYKIKTNKKDIKL